jgi:acyl-CoA thioester hydrolase
MSAAGFRWTVRVYYEDTDAAGIVYYASYLKFMERARTEWLRSRGFEQLHLAREHGVVFAVARLAVRYGKPARLDERLEVGVGVTRLGRAGFDIAHDVTREDGTAVCTGSVRIACLQTQSLSPRAIPTFLLTELRRDH